MARIRSVKPEFWDSPGIETLDPYWRLLYIAMWNWADDTGRGKAEARELMGFAFPRDEDMTVGEFRRGLGEVRRVFGVEFYRVEGRSYYAIPAWDRHQKIDKRSGSRWPSPEEGEVFDPATNELLSASFGGDSENPAEVSPSVRRDSGAGTGEQGNRGTEEKNRVAPTSSGAALFPIVDAELVEPEPKRTVAKAPAKPETPEQRVTAAAYERTGKAFKFVAVRAITKWAIHDRGADPGAVEAALVGVHELGKPITRQTVAQWLDGHIGPNRRPGPSKQDAKVNDYLESGRRLAEQLGTSRTTNHNARQELEA